MTPLRSMPVWLTLSVLLAIAGCAHKKPVLVVPSEQPPATAPVAAQPAAEVGVPASERDRDRRLRWAALLRATGLTRALRSGLMPVVAR